MLTTFINLLTIFLNWVSPANGDSELKRWAKVEYGKDWEFAYRFIKHNPGIVPKKGVHI
tara:strand:- start:423 stop:599 length:177 start_codon:yes stop_codon:yes gene_type:complete